MGRPLRPEHITEWVDAYFHHLDRHGSFAFAWIQAAHEDEDLRRAGMAGHLDLCRRLGEAAARLGGREVEDPTSLGLAIDSLMQHSWAFADLYGDGLDRSSLLQTIASIVTSAAVGDTRPKALRRPKGQRPSPSAIPLEQR
jgi:hypothetical protein